MSDNEKQRKRDRGANYTHEEKALLVELIKQYKDIVENKNSGAIVTNQKKEVWREITRKFNSNCTTGPRATDQLKALYDNLKQKARRNTGESVVIKKKTEYVKTQKILAQIEALQAEADLKKELETMKEEDKVQITGGGFWKQNENNDNDVMQDHVGPLTNPYDSGPGYFKDDPDSSDLIELSDLTGSPTRDLSIKLEVVIDESQPYMEQYPSQPVPTRENIPSYLVPSTSFNSHAEDAKETAQDEQNQNREVTTPSTVLTPGQRKVMENIKVPTDQQKLRKPTSIDALKRTYLKKKWRNACLERKRIMQEILHSKLRNHRQQQEHNLKLIILKKQLEMLNNKAVVGTDGANVDISANVNVDFN